MEYVNDICKCVYLNATLWCKGDNLMYYKTFMLLCYLPHSMKTKSALTIAYSVHIDDTFRLRIPYNYTFYEFRIHAIWIPYTRTMYSAYVFHIHVFRIHVLRIPYTRITCSAYVFHTHVLRVSHTYSISTHYVFRIYMCSAYVFHMHMLCIPFMQ